MTEPIGHMGPLSTIFIPPNPPESCVVLRGWRHQTETHVYDNADTAIFDDWTPTERAVWGARLRSIADLLDGRGNA